MPYQTGIPRIIYRLRLATLEEYGYFLTEYVNAGGCFTHFYEYPFERAGIQITDTSATIPSGCGVNAINLIVPRGVKVTRTEGHDHGNSYNMESLTVTGTTCSWAPLYEDLAQVISERGWEFTKEEFDPNVDQEQIDRLVRK